MWVQESQSCHLGKTDSFQIDIKSWFCDWLKALIIIRQERHLVCIKWKLSWTLASFSLLKEWRWMFRMHKCWRFLFRLDKKLNIDENDNLIFEISKWTRLLSVSHLIDLAISEQYSNVTFVKNVKFLVLFYDFMTIACKCENTMFIFFECRWNLSWWQISGIRMCPETENVHGHAVYLENASQ